MRRRWRPAAPWVLRLGAYADNVAAHIRRDLQTYADGEAAGAGTLST